MIIANDNGFTIAGRAMLLGESDDRLQAWAEHHVRSEPDLKWLLGNFIEAERANSNGHIFPLDEIKAGLPSIQYKALDMLHHDQYCVGAFAGGGLVDSKGNELKADDQPAEGAYPVMESLAAMWYKRFPDEFLAIRGAHAEGALYYCVDPTTECLTDRGWRSHQDVSVGDYVMTLNPATGLSEWQPVDAMNVFDYVGPMLEMEGLSHSSLTTPTHRWWVRRKKSRGGQVVEWRTSESLTTLCSIPTAAPRSDYPEVQKHTDALVEVAAWYWTEGTRQRNGAKIYQSRVANEPNCRRIESALTRLWGAPAKVADGGLWYCSERPTGMNHYCISAKAAATLFEIVKGPDKVPAGSFLAEMTESQLRVFLDISMAGDGTVYEPTGHVSLNQSNLDRIRAFEMLCALLGIPTSTQTDKVNGGWRVTLVRRGSGWVNPMEAAQQGRRRGGDRAVSRWVDYSGQVWCPTTANHTWLARRNGHVYFTGNSHETVPTTVQCPTCNMEAAFDGLVSETYCAHMSGRTGPKIVHGPTFTGGAVIIPPVRPGWNRAEMKTVAEYIDAHQQEAEDVYEAFAAELDHLSPTQWEGMMLKVMATRT